MRTSFRSQAISITLELREPVGTEFALLMRIRKPVATPRKGYFCSSYCAALALVAQWIEHRFPKRPVFGSAELHATMMLATLGRS